MDFKNVNLSNLSIRNITYIPMVSSGLQFYVDAMVDPTWQDLSGQGYTVTTHSGMTYSTDHGGSFVFDGSSDAYADITAGFGYNYSAGITVNVWAKYNGSGNGPWSRLIDFGNGAPGNNIIMCQEETSNYLIMDLEGNNSNFGSYEYGEPLIDLDAWTMYTLYADGTYWKIYKNGQFQTYQTNSDLPVTITRNSNYIGRSNWNGDGFFYGSMSVVQLYNRALTEPEILQNYQHFAQRII